MPTAKHLSEFEHTAQLTHDWVRDMTRAGDLGDEDRAFAALRATLHTLRDRLTVEEAAHLSAQLPILLRGIFFEGWKPSHQPSRERDLAAFLAHVHDELSGQPIEPEEAVRATFRVLNDRISGGETEHVLHMLPEEVRNLWPKAA